MYEAALAFAVLSFLATCAYFWRSPAFSIFHPLTFYLAFHGILFVFRPILAWVRGYTKIYGIYDFTPSLADKTTVIVAAAIGLLCFAFFSLRAGPMPMRFAADAAVQEERRRLSQIFVWVLVICGPPTAYSLLGAYSTNSIYDGMTMDGATGVVINTTKIGYITDLQLMAVSLCALAAWLGRFRLWSFLPLLAFITLKAGTGMRGPFITAMVAVGLFYFYEKRLRYPGVRVILASVLLLGFFSFVGQDRGATIRQAVGLEEKDAFAKSENTDRFMEGMDFGNMEYFEFLVHVIPERSGTYDYFLDNLQVFTEPVPRLLWREKPVGEPFRRIWLFEYGFPVGMTRSVPGEGWYALGWLGVVIWCSLWGHALGRIYARFVTGTQSTMKTASYMIFLPILIVGLRDGLLLTIVRQTGAYLAPVFVWFVLARYMGIPTAAQLRALMARARARETEKAAPAQPSSPLPLPPAVRRRRAFLQQSTAEPAE